jgi:hypothetical protein
MTSGKGIRYTIELQKEMRAKLPFDDKLASEGAMGTDKPGTGTVHRRPPRTAGVAGAYRKCAGGQFDGLMCLQLRT